MPLAPYYFLIQLLMEILGHLCSMLSACRVHQVLTPEEVARCNSAIDERAGEFRERTGALRVGGDTPLAGDGLTGALVPRRCRALPPSPSAPGVRRLACGAEPSSAVGPCIVGYRAARPWRNWVSLPPPCCARPPSLLPRLLRTAAPSLTAAIFAPSGRKARPGRRAGVAAPGRQPLPAAAGAPAPHARLQRAVRPRIQARVRGPPPVRACVCGFVPLVRACVPGIPT